jgi:hypothetical protein
MKHVGLNVALSWLIRILALAGVVMMIVSFTQPWWIGNFGPNEAINIYGWGLRHNLTTVVASYVSGDVTPANQVALAWGYVGLSAVVALIGAWIRKWWGSIFLGAAGLGLMAYAHTAVNVVITNRLADFGIKLEGVSMVGVGITVEAMLQPGYVMAYIVGGVLAALAIIKAITSFIFRKSV